MALKTLKIKIRGVTSLLQHNSQLANPLNKYAKMLGELSTQKKRTGADKDDLLAQMADVEWEGGLYFSPVSGPYLPAMMIKANIIEGAKLTRGGRDVTRSVNVMPGEVPLLYEGPRDLETLKADVRFRDQRIVTVSQSKVLRTRPRFDNWSLEYTAVYNDKGMEREDLIRYITDAGMFEGLGDGRGKPGCGRYEIESVDGQVLS